MSELKKFLNRRAEGLAEEKKIKEGIVEEENPNLTDDEFWEILNQFKLESKSNNNDPSDILQRILEQYSVLKINQFAERYKNLNK
jgi:hypothetical protein